MIKKVLMVYPEIPATYWSLEHSLKFTGDKTLMPPLGLITVAALLPKEYEVRLKDLNLDRISIDDLRWADIVFVSAMIVQKESFDEVVALCNEAGVPVAAGGPYPTTSHEGIEGVDYFILNEGEITLPEFIRDYEAGTPKGLYKDETKPDITNTPVPRFDLLDVNAYSVMALQNSRGCPFNCEFCDIIEMFGRNPRYKLPEQFIREMEGVYETGYRGPLFIVDDNFIGNKKKVKELLRGIIAWQEEYAYPFTLFTEASINMAQDEELMDLMVRAGMDMIFIGLETPDEEALKRTNKGQNAGVDLLESVSIIQRKGIEVLAGFILGFDNETDDIFDRQIEFIQKAGIPMAMVGMLLALPGTQLQRRLTAEGRFLGETSGNNTHSMELNFRPTMEPQKLKEGYKRVLAEIYGPERYFDRCVTMIERFPEKRFIEKGPLTLRDIRALFMSLGKQTFSRYGFHYLAYLFRVLRRNSREFALAITLAVKGYHFFRITKEILALDAFGLRSDDVIKTMEEKLRLLLEVRGDVRPMAYQKIGERYIRKQERLYKRLPEAIRDQARDNFDENVIACNDMIVRYQRQARGRKGISLRNRAHQY